MSFTVQGLCHLAEFYNRFGRRADAVKALREAQAFARKYEISSR